VHMDQFALDVAESKNPVCYNGDLTSVAGVRALETRFPNLNAAMIGRGAIADPALFRRLRGGPAATKEELQAFTAELYLAGRPTQLQPRFDVIEIYAPQGERTERPRIFHWENAF